MEVTQAAIGWMESNKERSSFAASLWSQFCRKGFLSDAQCAAIQRSVDHANATRNAPEVSLPQVEEMFQRAKSNGLQRPRLTIGEFRLSLAGENSVNAGAIYAKSDEGVYLGKFKDGRFLKSFACPADAVAGLLDIAKDPLGAAIRHGKLTGGCAVCNRKLSDPQSVERGIGPICAVKFGW